MLYSDSIAACTGCLTLGQCSFNITALPTALLQVDTSWPTDSCSMPIHHTIWDADQNAEGPRAWVIKICGEGEASPWMNPRMKQCLHPALISAFTLSLNRKYCHCPNRAKLLDFQRGETLPWQASRCGIEVQHLDSYNLWHTTTFEDKVTKSYKCGHRPSHTSGEVGLPWEKTLLLSLPTLSQTSPSCPIAPSQTQTTPSWSWHHPDKAIFKKRRPEGKKNYVKQLDSYAVPSVW